MVHCDTGWGQCLSFPDALCPQASLSPEPPSNPRRRRSAAAGGKCVNAVGINANALSGPPPSDSDGFRWSEGRGKSLLKPRRVRFRAKTESESDESRSQGYPSLPLQRGKWYCRCEWKLKKIRQKRSKRKQNVLRIFNRSRQDKTNIGTLKIIFTKKIQYFRILIVTGFLNYKKFLWTIKSFFKYLTLKVF